ncbi:hypothetical protein M8J76_010424 [Diaphorina citri]|nr:hypothetical protein M8J75_004931 [Diaphorina citri]KAI5733313.1 hypothetical protein M8J76_010424 [Diaphorina citri]
MDIPTSTSTIQILKTLFDSLLQAEEIEKIVLGCLDECRVLSPTRHMKSADLRILHTFMLIVRCVFIHFVGPHQ